MTPYEIASLRTAVLLVLPIYAAAFIAFGIWNPFRGLPGGPAAGAPVASPVLYVEISMQARTARETKPPDSGTRPDRSPRALPVKPGTPRSDRPASESASSESARTSKQGERAALSTKLHAEPEAGGQKSAAHAEPSTAKGPRAGGGARPALPSTGQSSSGGLLGSSGTGEERVTAVLMTIRRRIEQARSYPPSAQRRDIQGSVTVRAVVDADGGLVASRVVSTSGSAILDDAGLALLRRVFPVPSTVGHGFSVEVTISYRLSDSLQGSR